METPYLEISTDGADEQHIELSDTPITVGRQDGNVLIVHDNLASRKHCVIEREGDGYQVRDLGSRNGTLLNDARIDTATLEPGDRITIGGTAIRFMIPGVEVVELAAEREAEPEEGRKGLNLRKLSPFGRKKQSDEQVRLTSITTEHESELRQLAGALPDIEYGEDQVMLINAREQVVHGAGEGLFDEGDVAGFEAVHILRLLLWVCVRMRATDLHIEPKRDHMSVRARVDGMMLEVINLDRELGVKITSIVKVLGDIDIAQRMNIQEGHFTTQVPGRRIDNRVSFTPSVHGQKLVVRVLDLANAPKVLPEVNLPDWMYTEVARASKQDAGMILVCGPTGSGKTTTLYALLRSLDLQHRNVITIEDPVEYQIEGVTQMPINEAQGNSFSTLLRSVLRQDPDVILVGEIRDPETARIAMQAAITGHLVLSTVHAKDGIGTIFRLLDLKVEPYLVASGLHLVLTQRLVRQLCDECKFEKKPLPQQSRQLQQLLGSVPNVYKPCGCPRCFDTGFIGRRAIFELLVATQELRDVILKDPNMADIRKSLEKTLFTSLASNGHRLVAEGHTSFEEIDRVTGTSE